MQGKKTYRLRLTLVQLIVLGSVLVSCKDYFELERAPENPWTTIQEFERAPVGAYGVLFGSHEWVQAWSNYAVIMTSLGDDVEWVNDNKWGYWRNTPEGSDRTDLSDRNIWLLYRGIGAVNDALDFVEANDGDPYPEASDDEIAHGLDRIVGELHFLRGVSYYMLQTTFGHAYVPGGENASPDITLHKSFAASTEEATNPEIGTTQQVWDLILEDFLEAKRLLPSKFDAAIHDPSYEVRANRFAASAMLMRTYFQRGEYSQAISEADFIIEQNNGEYDLSEDPIEAFNKSGFGERGRETIWYLPYSDQSLYPDYHLSVMNATWNGAPCEWNETRMGTKTLKRLNWIDDPETSTSFNLEARRDKRFQQLILVRYPQSSASVDQEVDKRAEIANEISVWPWKYYRGPGQDFTNVPLIRLAEVLLTRSILRYNAGDFSGAAEDLNIVRSRSWDTDIGGAYVEIDPGSITAEMIHEERLIEMFNEADRINYLRGLKLDIPKGDRGEGSDPYTSEIFVWPIPQSETLYNDNLSD